MAECLLNEMGWEGLANIRLRRLEEVNRENIDLRTKIESDARVIAEKDTEIRSMIAVHNSDVDGMRLQEEKIADQKRVIATLRKALEAATFKLQLYRAKNDGEYVGGMEYTALMQMIAKAVRSNEQTAGESK